MDFTPENAEKYVCEICDFKCCKNSDKDRHLLTRKHQNRTILNHLEPKSANLQFNCKYCQKSYKVRNSLWYHENKCNSQVNTISIKSEDVDDKSIQENMMLTNLVLEVIKSNSDIQKQNQDFQNKILETFQEVMKNGTNVTNNNNTMTHSHNKTFNLQIFLNETCKDAMNIMDFVDSLKLQLCDLERIGEVGFVTGISDIIIKNLKALDVSKRPVHCADTKREVMYVKDNNIWEKEQEGNKKLKKAIKHIAKKNSMNINLFKDKYPECVNSHSRKSDQFNKIYIEAYGGSGNEDVDNENKIIKNIAKVVFIDKSL